jgi:hypothetical protein
MQVPSTFLWDPDKNGTAGDAGRREQQRDVPAGLSVSMQTASQVDVSRLDHRAERVADDLIWQNNRQLFDQDSPADDGNSQ